MAEITKFDEISSKVVLEEPVMKENPVSGIESQATEPESEPSEQNGVVEEFMSEPTEAHAALEEVVEIIEENGVVEESMIDVANAATIAEVTDDKIIEEIVDTTVITVTEAANESIETEIVPESDKVKDEVETAPEPEMETNIEAVGIENEVAEPTSENVIEELLLEDVVVQPKEVDIVTESLEEPAAADPPKEDVEPETQIALEQTMAVEVDEKITDVVPQAEEANQVKVEDAEIIEVIEAPPKETNVNEDAPQVELIAIEEPAVAEIVPEDNIDVATEVVNVVPESATEPLFSTEVIPLPTEEGPVVEETESIAAIEDQVNAEVKDIKKEIEAVKSLVQKSEPPPVAVKGKDKVAEPVEAIESRTSGTKNLTIQINDDLPITGIVIVIFCKCFSACPLPEGILGLSNKPQTLGTLNLTGFNQLFDSYTAYKQNGRYCKQLVKISRI